jgi:hypothetical protein
MAGKRNGKKTATWVGVVLTILLILGGIATAWVNVKSDLANTYDKDETQDLIDPIRRDVSEIRASQSRTEGALEIILKRLPE